MRATRQQLPLLPTCRRDYVTVPSNHLLTEQYNSGPTNQSAKPPSEGVTTSWRSHHEISPKTHNQGRILALPLKRTTQWRTSKSLRYKASLAEMPHNRNRIHDGQEWSFTGHSLTTSQSGQE